MERKELRSVQKPSLPQLSVADRTTSPNCLSHETLGHSTGRGGGGGQSSCFSIFTVNRISSFTVICRQRTDF